MITSHVVSDLKHYAAGITRGWNQFWFTPRLCDTLGLLRIVTGLMLLYGHLVLASDLLAFIGPDGWMNSEVARGLHDGTLAEANAASSYLWNITSPTLLALHHGFTIVVTLAFAAGFVTRFAAPLALFLQLMYLHRLTGALFGLDQIATYCTMYLALTPCGSCYSVDARLRRKFAGKLTTPLKRWLLPANVPTVSANVATRLLQLHLCTIYLFGGLAKARGQMWWDGTAVWFAVANYEYQSVDMTWMASYPKLFSALTHFTLFWEVFYCALVWPKLTRPLVLLIAVCVHGGIAMFLGMITFGVMMIAANMIFVEPSWLRGKMGLRESNLSVDESAS